MGGGNGAKSKIARERNQKKAQDAKKGGVNQKEAAQKALTLVCQVCRTSFMSTSDRATLQQHQEAKHSKETFEKCFPNFDTE